MSARDEILAEFHRVYADDLAQRRIRPLEEYVALFPGQEEVVSTEYRVLEGDEPAPDSSKGHETLGPYRVLDELGRGGQAVVYRARHLELGREVALKVLRSAGLGGEPELRRFRREAEVTARLDHPGICSVYEAGEDGGTAYIAMRLVRGATLASLIADARDAEPETWSDPLSGSSTALGSSSTSMRAPWSRVVELIEACARALHVAHEQGLVHRDIKPGNIMVTDTGDPVLLDFGLARGDDTNGMTLTLSGDVLGTPYYMAPEQISTRLGKPDARTDVYCLGVTLFECLTLQRPFDAASREALFHEILEGQPKCATSVNPQIARDLAVVIETAMFSDRDHRYQSALDFAEDLRRIRCREPIRAKPMPWPLRARRWIQRNRTVTVAAVLVFVALAAGVWFSLDYARGEAAQRRATERQLYRADITAAFRELAAGNASTARQLLEATPAHLRGWEWEYLDARFDESVQTLIGATARISLTAFRGEDRVVGVDVEGVAHIWDRATGERSTARLPPLPGEAVDKRLPLAIDRLGTLVLTRVWRGQSGNAVAVLWEASSGKELRRFPTGIGSPVHLRSRTVISGCGTRVILPLSNTELGVYDAVDGRVLARLAGWQPALSDDGSLLAVLAQQTVEIWEMGTLGRAPKPRHDLVIGIPGKTGNLVGAAFSTDNRLLAVSDRQRVTVRNLERNSLVATMHPPSTHLGLRFCGAERLLVADRGLGLWDPWRGRLVDRYYGYRCHSYSAISVDEPGRLLAVDWHDGERFGVRIWQTAASNTRALRGHASYVYPVAFSPDGELIASGSWDNTVRLWDARSSAPVATLVASGRIRSLAFDPVRPRLVAMAGGDSGARLPGRLHVWSTTTGLELREPPKRPAWGNVAFSPDGSLLLVETSPGNENAWEVLDGASFEHRRTLPGPVGSIAFASDGSFFVGAGGYLRNDESIVGWRTDTLERAFVLESPEHVGSVAVAPDGKRLAAGTITGKIQVWDVTGDGAAPVGVGSGHTSDVFAVVYLDAGRIASGGRDGTIRIWDAATAIDVGTIRAHDSYVWSLAVSPDASSLVSGSGDGTVGIWEPRGVATRLAARRRYAELRARAESLVNRHVAAGKTVGEVADTVRTDRTLDPEIRRVARHAVLGRARPLADEAERVALLARPQAVNKVLVLDGRSAVDCGVMWEPGGRGLEQLTVECWAKSDDTDAALSILVGTIGEAGGGFGLVWRDAARRLERPHGIVHAGHEASTVAPRRGAPAGEWVHLALCFDGRTSTLFANGALAGRAEVSGGLVRSRASLLVGKISDHLAPFRGCFRGAIDELRLSRVARYSEPFVPARVHEPDDDTLLLMHFDVTLHGLHLDASKHGRHGWAQGKPKLVAQRLPVTGK